MNAHARHLAARRAELLERSAWLRQELAAEGTRVAASLGVLDRAVALIRSGVIRPALGLAAVVFLVVRPRAAWWIASRGAIFWPIVRRLVPRLVRILRSVEGSRPGDQPPLAK